MKLKPNFLFACAMMAFLLLASSCGDSKQSAAANDPDSIKKILAVSNPDLAKFEPKAKEVLEKQRAELDALLAQKDTPKSTLGLAYGQMGTQYFAHRFPQAALECFRNAAFLQPSALRWRYFLGRLHLEENRRDEARAAFKKALELQPNHAPSKICLGRMELSNGNIANAEPYFTEALQSQPQNAVAHFGMGAVKLEQGAFAEAARHLQTCLLLQPTARATHGLLAKALHGMDQPQAAALQERAAADREPLLRDPLMNEVTDQRFLLLYRIAEALRVNERDTEALNIYALAIDLRPDISGPRLGRALCLIRSGQHDQAITSLQDDILAGQDTANFKHMLSRLYAASPTQEVRNPEKALQILETLSQDHMSPGLAETIAMAMAHLNKFDTAIQYQETAIKMAMKAEQPEILSTLETNLARYRQKQPSMAPWAEDDPIFKMVTYQGETQLEKRPGA